MNNNKSRIQRGRNRKGRVSDEPTVFDREAEYDALLDDLTRLIERKAAIQTKKTRIASTPKRGRKRKPIPAMLARDVIRASMSATVAANAARNLAKE